MTCKLPAAAFKGPVVKPRFLASSLVEPVQDFQLLEIVTGTHMSTGMDLHALYCHHGAPAVSSFLRNTKAKAEISMGFSHMEG